MTTVDITGQLATYMAQARDMRLAPHVAQDAKHRILDALAAMVSGSHLPAGEMAIHFARAQGGVAEATVLATDIRTSAVNVTRRTPRSAAGSRNRWRGKAPLRTWRQALRAPGCRCGPRRSSTQSGGR